jgi:hypothetical protein
MPVQAGIQSEDKNTIVGKYFYSFDFLINHWTPAFAGVTAE